MSGYKITSRGRSVHKSGGAKTVDNTVRTYKLTPEELAAYGPPNPPKKRKPNVMTWKFGR